MYTNKSYSTFTNTFQEAYDSTIPLKAMKHVNKSSKKPWITDEHFCMIREKDKCYKEMKLKQCVASEQQYKKLRNKLANVLKSAERKYYRNTLEDNKTNLRKVWDTLNVVIHREKRKKMNSTFKYKDSEVNNEQQIAQLFNKYFLNVPRNLYKALPPETEDPTSYMKTNVNSLYLTPTDADEVLSLLKDMKNSSAGYDGISSITVKYVANELLEPLIHICNISLSLGEFPDEMKLARVVPIHKKGKKDQFNNYRPISVLPVFSKLLERLMYNRIVEFIDKFSLLHDNQFGFRKSRSTSMALNVLVDKYHQALQDKKYMVGLFVDLSRAFDTLSHDILIEKLSKYGIRGTALDWIRSYLSNRKQFVSYGSKKSDVGNIEIGVPQGSILGPLLFLLYINDLCNVSKRVSFIQFADDTSIYCTGSSLENVCSTIEAEMALICDWLNNNKLSLNVSKTNYMIMTPSYREVNDDLTIKVNGETIERVSETKFLGVILDRRLTFKSHIDYIANKIAKCVGLLSKAKHILSTDSLRTLYVAIVQPYLSYCIEIWGHTYESYSKKLFLLQKRIVRTITFSKYDDHSLPLFKSLRILPYKEQYEYTVASLVFKSLTKKLPYPFENYFIPNMSQRTSDSLRSPFCSHKLCEFSVRVMGPRIWNKLNQNIKSSKSHFIFKKLYKSSIFASM